MQVSEQVNVRQRGTPGRSRATTCRCVPDLLPRGRGCIGCGIGAQPGADSLRPANRVAGFGHVVVDDAFDVAIELPSQGGAGKVAQAREAA